MIFWRCRCGQMFFTRECPTDHARPWLDGNTVICSGPFEKWEARRV